jgi:cytochrome c5
MSSDQSTDHAQPKHDSDAQRRQRFGLLLTIGLFMIAAGVSYSGTRSAWIVADRRPDSKFAAISDAAADPVSDLELPLGPNRDEFQTSCLTCHSARLPLGQPPFGRKKWDEIVHKMVAIYGAPMTPENESHVVEYLLVARPPAP